MEVHPVTAGSCFFFDIIKQKVEEVKPVLQEHYQGDLDQALTDKQEIHKVLGILTGSKLGWTSQEILGLWPKTRASKNNDVSLKAREEGNKFFKNSQLYSAIGAYNEAILWGDPGGSQLALGLANRAFAWMKAKEFKKAIVDLRMALDSGQYPKENAYKLYHRLGVCHFNQEETCEAVQSFENALENLKQSGLSLTKRAEMATELQVLKSKAKKVQKNPIPSNRESLAQAKTPPGILDQHLDLPGTSNAVKVEYSDILGRYAVAARDIQVGEVVIEEEAAGSVLMLDQRLNHCYHCLTFVISAIPCKSCASVVFCSNQCRLDAEQSHKHECPLSLAEIHMNHGNKGTGATSLIFLGYRLLTKKPAKFYLDNCGYFDQPNTSSVSKSRPGFDGQDIVFNTVLHMDSSLHVLEKILTAIFLLNCLQMTGYLDKCDGSNLESVFGGQRNDVRADVQVFFASLLFQNSLAILSNNHAISEIDPSNLKKSIVGLAMFPKVASIINHSCDPNTCTVVVKSKQITLATRIIKEGEQICHVYTGHFADTPRKERQAALKSFYHFDCHCQACLEDYPLFAKCPQTFTEVDPNLADVDKEYQFLGNVSEQAWDMKDYAKATDILCKRLSLACQHLKSPHKILIMDRAMLVQALTLCYGNQTYQAGK